MAALRGYLTGFCQVLPKGAANDVCLFKLVEDPDTGHSAQAVTTLKMLVDAIAGLDVQIAQLDLELQRQAQANEVALKLITVPGIGPLIAIAISVLAPPSETVRRGGNCCTPMNIQTGPVDRRSSSRVVSS